MYKMNLAKVLAGATALTLIVASAPVRADEGVMVPASQTDPGLQAIPTDAMPSKNGHAKTPAGVYAANMIDAGKVMFSYTPMYMRMEGNYIGTTKVSPETIVTTVPSGLTMNSGGMTVPEMYRIVPTSMDVETHMFHLMYGVADGINLMAMASYLNKSMSMTTFAGSAGSTVLGQSSSSTSGVGDTTVNSLWRIYQSQASYAHMDWGLSLPTGSINASASMLTPMNKIMTMRATYGMQLGTGTVDLLPGLTYVNHADRWSWGWAYRGRIPLGNNSNGYRYGDKHELDAWSGYDLTHTVTLTGRIAGTTQSAIHGADPQISGLMQGSNPAFYGGKRIDLLGGIAISGSAYGYRSSNLSIEAGGTVYQNLNGPQLGNAWQVNAAVGIGM